MVVELRVRGTSFLMLLGLMTSSVVPRQRIVYSNLATTNTDNLLALAVLGRDSSIGQCASYYKLTVEFRQDLGTIHYIVNVTDRNSG